jgi:hypothetical protein
MALEQLSVLSPRGGWPGSSESGMDRNFVSRSGSVASPLPAFPYPPLQKTQGRGTLQHRLLTIDQKPGPPGHFRLPPFAKDAKSGAPPVFLMRAKSKNLRHRPTLISKSAKDGPTGVGVRCIGRQRSKAAGGGARSTWESFCILVILGTSS